MSNRERLWSACAKGLLAVIAALLLYVLSDGPMYGLYYIEERTPTEVEGWFHSRFYAPVTWLGHQPGVGQAAQDYRYWWYIKMKRILNEPPHRDP